MTKILQYGRGVALYVLLAVAIALSVWSFVRSDQYRQRSIEILHQTFEVQWRASQIREKTILVVSYLDGAEASGRADDRLETEVNFLRFNIRTLLDLDYTPAILYPRDIGLLRNMMETVEGRLAPEVQAGRYSDALATAMSIRRDIVAVSGTAVSHSQSLSDEAIVDAAVEQNHYQFALAITVVIVIFLFIHHRSLIARREDEHLRSFSALFGHITRSRIAPLRLILNRLSDESELDRSSVELAQRAVQELVAINEELVRIAYAGSSALSKADSRPEPLAAVLDAVVKAHDRSDIRLDVEEDAKAVLVPASEFHVLLDELVVNAKKAVASRDGPVITLAARVKRDWLLRRKLFLRVSDNGGGMPPDVLSSATTLFFSTRGGSHVGLGLASCAAILKAMGGKLRLDSAPDAGTTVRITYPMR